jgi:hypothetical protein
LIEEVTLLTPLHPTTVLTTSILMTFTESDPLALDAVTLYWVAGARAVGVPEMAQVAVETESPAGSAGETVQRVGTPPVFTGTPVVEPAEFKVKLKVVAENAIEGGTVTAGGVPPFPG